MVTIQNSKFKIQNSKLIHPLQRLLAYGKNYYFQTWQAVISSIFNKLCDIAPEILIGAAVDVVVKKQCHPSSGVTRLKLWADKVLENIISNISSVRFTHIFSLVVPVGWALPTNILKLKSILTAAEFYMWSILFLLRLNFICG